MEIKLKLLRRLLAIKEYYMRIKEFKPGVWVRFNDQTCIIFKNDKKDSNENVISSMLELHVIAEDGTTSEVIPMQSGDTENWSLDNLVIAEFNQIPEVRRPTEEVGNSLGYV